MKEDISTLERNARLMMQQKEYPGYRGCSAVGNTLHFYFDTPDNAQTCSFEIGFDSVDILPRFIGGFLRLTT
jgi:hypothetical protein